MEQTLFVTDRQMVKQTSISPPEEVGGGGGWYTVIFFGYGSLPKTSNTLKIRTPKNIAKSNFKMFPKISNSGQFSEIEFLKFRTESFFAKK